jgi:siroheme synthase
MSARNGVNTRYRRMNSTFCWSNLPRPANASCASRAATPTFSAEAAKKILAAHGVPFEVVPGVTAAAGVAAYAGIPLTHREHAQACVLVTGHLKDGSADLDWIGLARKEQTVVIYMGLQGLPTICEKLIQHGLPMEWPAAIVQQGTTARQKTVVGTLSTLPALAEAAQLKAPTLIIVGSVVSLREKLAWLNEPLAL